MARRSAAQNKVISDKISKLKREGYQGKQATAIAMRMYRDGELPKPRTVKKKAPTRRSRTTKRTSRSYRKK